jgi:predicted transcriptional regulator
LAHATRSRILRQPHRDYYEIIRQILQNVYAKVGGCKPSELAYRCDLSWKQVRGYRDILVNQKLLVPSNSEPSDHYEITPKGERYLKLIAEIEDDLFPVNNVTS